MEAFEGSMRRQNTERQLFGGTDAWSPTLAAVGTLGSPQYGRFPVESHNFSSFQKELVTTAQLGMPEERGLWCYSPRIGKEPLESLSRCQRWALTLARTTSRRLQRELVCHC